MEGSTAVKKPNMAHALDGGIPSLLHICPQWPAASDVMRPNEAHSVAAPIASLFHIVHHWRRATDAQRSALVIHNQL